MNRTVWIWQEMVTPHQLSFAESLSDRGFIVNYIAYKEISNHRKSMGWENLKSDKINIILVNDFNVLNNTLKLTLTNSECNVHLCQGIRGNSYVKYVQSFFKKYNVSFFVVMETIDIRSKAFIKKLVYSFLFYKYRRNIEGVLAIGKNTKRWLNTLFSFNIPVFEFAYFLGYNSNTKIVKPSQNNIFSFVFVGELIKIKNVQLLLSALSQIEDFSFNLHVIGDGPERLNLSNFASKNCKFDVFWHGKVSINTVPDILINKDCLILPSLHDGWGAVVSEGLFQGVIPICSTACGSSVIVEKIDKSLVFESNNVDSLKYSIRYVLNNSSTNYNLSKDFLTKYSSAVSSEYGSFYLIDIINYTRSNSVYPKPPWSKF